MDALESEELTIAIVTGDGSPGCSTTRETWCTLCFRYSSAFQLTLTISGPTSSTCKFNFSFDWLPRKEKCYLTNWHSIPVYGVPCLERLAAPRHAAIKNSQKRSCIFVTTMWKFCMSPNIVFLYMSGFMQYTYSGIVFVLFL